MIKKLVLCIFVIMLSLFVSSAQTGTEYYVGTDNCSDSGSGQLDQPYCTFEYALQQLQPGDTLIIKAGTYAHQLIISDLSGLPDNPITIRGEDAEAVIFEGGCASFPCDITSFNWEFTEWDMAGWDLSWELDGFISIRDSWYLNLQDLTIQNVAMEGIHIESGGNLLVSNVRVNGTGNGGIIAYDVDNIIVDNNQLNRNQMGYIDRSGDPQIGYHEALSIIASHDFEVSNNILRTILKEGIDIKESSSNGTVYNNTLEYICSVGIYINEAEDITVSGNTVSQIGFWLVDGVETECGDDPIYGEAFDRYYGTGILIAVGDLGDVSQGRLSDITFNYNVVEQSREDCIQFWDEWRDSGIRQGEMTRVQIYNNTLVDCGLAGIRIDDADEISVINNIIALTEEDPIIGNSVDDSDVSHNLFQLQYDWQTATGNNTLTGDPLFVDAFAGDFRLQGNSPAIDAGRDVGLPYTDNVPDIGAFEYRGD